MITQGVTMVAAGRGIASFVACAAALCFTGREAAAQAQDHSVCQSWVGTTPNVVRFDSLETLFWSVKPRDEFETTADYYKRSAVIAAGEPIVIHKDVEDRKYLLYNADRGRIELKSYAFNNMQADWIELLARADTAVERPRVNDSHAVVIARRDSVVDRYQGKTAMNVEFAVTKLRRKTYALYDRPSSFIKGRGIFPIANLDSISLSLEEARRLKDEARIAFVFLPRVPFFVRGATIHGTPSLRDPFDIEEVYTVAIGNIPCALLMDGSGKVLRAYRTTRSD